MATQEETFKKIVAHCKEYGFVFPSSEIYDGLAAVYDYGQNGVELKNNIKRYWWDSMTLLHQNIVGIDAAIFNNLFIVKRAVSWLPEAASFFHGDFCKKIRNFYAKLTETNNYHIKRLQSRFYLLNYSLLGTI